MKPCVNRVLPEIREVVGDRRVRIVFDREGWSRELFDDLLRLNFDFITYRKGNYEPLPESEFEDGRSEHSRSAGRGVRTGRIHVRRKKAGPSCG